MAKKKFFITGLPGVGKTTLVKKLSEELDYLHPVGFYTEEIREKGERKGFELVSLNGKRGILSHKDIKSSYRVGSYKVDIESFENFIDVIPFFGPLNRLIIIDEIGKMECLSDRFKNLLKKILDSGKLVVATIALKSGGFIENIRKRPNVKLFELKENNRNDLLSEILREVKGSNRGND